MQSFRRIVTASVVGIALALVFQLAGVAQEGDKNPNRAGGVIKSISGNVITTARKNGATTSIVVSESTAFSRNGSVAALADFQPGDFIKADGAPDATGQFVATSVSAAEKGAKRERRVGGSEPTASDENKGEHKGEGGKANRSGGQITAVDVTAGTVSVTRKNGAADTIRVSENATIARNGQTASLADFKAGDFVKAWGSRGADGQLVADNVIGGDQKPQGRKAKKQQ